MKEYEMKISHERIYTTLGYTEFVNSCMCCGKQNLKGTVAMGGPGGIVYFGTTCAAKNSNTTVKTINRELTKKGKENYANARNELRSMPERQEYIELRSLTWEYHLRGEEMSQSEKDRMDLLLGIMNEKQSQIKKKYFVTTKQNLWI